MPQKFRLDVDDEVVKKIQKMSTGGGAWSDSKLLQRVLAEKGPQTRLFRWTTLTKSLVRRLIARSTKTFRRISLVGPARMRVWDSEP